MDSKRPITHKKKKAYKQKKCKNLECRKLFQPWASTETACSLPCALAIVQQNKAKRYQKETHELRKNYLDNDIKHWKNKAKNACHSFILLRDADLPCISCGRHHSGQYHAGHYKTRKAHPEIQFHHFNIHKQCAPCNNHLSGNIVNYRLNLIERIGPRALEWLESYHEPYKYTIADYQGIFDWYTELRDAL